MDKICVYTCITGNYDNLKEISTPEKDIDYYCFTNNKNLKSKTWKIIQINDKMDNRLLARKIKILGHPLINENYNITVWTDADVIWQTPISEFIKIYFKNTNFSIFRHHARKNIYDEAIACLTVRKDNKENILKLLNFYKTENFKDDNGLCESTVFIKNPRDQKIIKTLKIWYDIVKNYSPRDQLSFNYAIWKTGLKVSYIDLNVWGNPWFSTTPHNPEPKIDSCLVYYGNPEQKANISKYSVYDYTEKDRTYFFSTTIPYTTREIVFYPTTVIGVKYQNLIITPKPKHLDTNGITAAVSCNPLNTFHVYGDFQKGEKLSFSFDAGILNPNEISNILKLQFNQNTKIIQNLQFDNNQLIAINTQLSENLHDIINSKGWRTLEKARKFFHLKKH